MAWWSRSQPEYYSIVYRAAEAVAELIPELRGKLTGMSFRVPVANVSVVDLTVSLERATSYESLCEVVLHASQNDYQGIIRYVDGEPVSSDFIGCTHTSIFDARAGISLNDKFFKLIAWYDNEMAYATKTLELASHISA